MKDKTDIGIEACKKERGDSVGSILVSWRASFRGMRDNYYRWPAVIVVFFVARCEVRSIDSVLDGTSMLSLNSAVSEPHGAFRRSL